MEYIVAKRDEDRGTGDLQTPEEKREGHLAQQEAAAAVGGADYLSPEEAAALKATRKRIKERGEEEPALVAQGLTPEQAPIKAAVEVGPVVEAPAPEPVVEHKAHHQSGRKHT